MPIGTRRKGLQVERVLLLLPTSLTIRLEVLPGLYDRFHQNTIFGARAQLLTSLISDWIKDPSEEDLLEVIVPRRRPGPKTQWLLRIPTTLDTQVKALPGFTRSFGAYSRLATLLFTRWVEIQEAKIVAATTNKELTP